MYMSTTQRWLLVAALCGVVGCAVPEDTDTTASEVTSGDFAVLNGPNTPTTATVKRGSGTLFDFTVEALGGFDGVVTFTITGMPIKTMSHFDPPMLTGSGDTTFLLQTIKPAHDPGGTGTPTGTYPLTVTGTSGTLSHSAGVTLIVR
jgi:hypothetical protein